MRKSLLDKACMNLFLKDIANAVRKSCRSISTTIDNKKLKVKLLSESLLDDDDIRMLHALMETYDAWIITYIEESKINTDDYWRQFFACTKGLADNLAVSLDKGKGIHQLKNLRFWTMFAFCYNWSKFHLLFVLFSLCLISIL